MIYNTSITGITIVAGPLLLADRPWSRRNVAITPNFQSNLHLCVCISTFFFIIFTTREKELNDDGRRLPFSMVQQ